VDLDGNRAAGLLTNNANVLKVELHSHSSDDPIDRIPHTTIQLIDRAADLGYGALAITLHDRQLEIAPYESYARTRGLTLIPGIERTIGRKHVLLINFSRAAEEVQSFDDLARLREREPGLVVAPHPFFPHPNCLHGVLDRYSELFDAVEYNAMFTASINFNRAAVRWARTHGKPLVGNGDVHRLRQLGTTYSLVEAEPHPDAICAAIRAGKVRVESQPLPLVAAAAVAMDLFGLRWHRSAPQAPAPECSTV
jgi:predicted metal-dependent phosphoesterase TrpH